MIKFGLIMQKFPEELDYYCVAEIMAVFEKLKVNN